MKTTTLPHGLTIKEMSKILGRKLEYGDLLSYFELKALGFNDAAFGLYQSVKFGENNFSV